MFDSNDDYRMWQEAEYQRKNDLITVNKTEYEKLKQKVEQYEKALQEIAHYRFYEYETHDVKTIARAALGNLFIKDESDTDYGE